MGRSARLLAVVMVVCLGVVASLTGVASAGSSGSSTEVFATLKIEKPKVEVKKKGADTFKVAKDGQKLREGDTVRTDATGLAEIDYSDDAYTRLDVNTTFKITKLTEEQGARQIAGSLESGQTWNRIEDVSESGSFEQSGAGATAAITGTVFMVSCVTTPNIDPTLEPANECSFISVEHTITVTSENGEVRVLTEHTECTSDDADLCDTPRELTLDELAAIDWLQSNLFKDLTLARPGHRPDPHRVRRDRRRRPGGGDRPDRRDRPVALTAADHVEHDVLELPAARRRARRRPPPRRPPTTTLPPPGVAPLPIDVQGGGNSGCRRCGDPGIDVPTGRRQSGIVTEDEVGELAPGGVHGARSPTRRSVASCS